MSGFRMDDYVDVAERIQSFYERFPDGRLTTGSPPMLVNIGDKPFIWYHAKAYRTPDDPLPGDGWAAEPVPGPTQFTRDSELMNAETAAWGRAIVALGFSTKKIASFQEVRNRQGSTGEVGKPQSHESPAEPHRPSQAPSPVETPSLEERAVRWLEREGDAAALAKEIRDTVATLENLEHLGVLWRLEAGREMRTGGKKKPRGTVQAAIRKRILELGGILEGEPSPADDSLSPEEPQDSPASPSEEFAPLAEPSAAPSGDTGTPSDEPSAAVSDVALGSANGSAPTLLRLKAALAFIQDQPASVGGEEKARAWTKTNVLFALSNKNPENTFGSLEEIPEHLVDVIYGFVPDEVRGVVDSYGPEALAAEADKAK